jgi:hypothetical protein
MGLNLLGGPPLAAYFGLLVVDLRHATAFGLCTLQPSYAQETKKTLLRTLLAGVSATSCMASCGPNTSSNKFNEVMGKELPRQ